MKRKTIALLTALLVAGFAGVASAENQTEKKDQKEAVAVTKEAAAPATFDVFIDGVTGYAFVRTPDGWKFIRNIKDELRRP